MKLHEAVKAWRQGLATAFQGQLKVSKSLGATQVDAVRQDGLTLFVESTERVSLEERTDTVVVDVYLRLKFDHLKAEAELFALEESIAAALRAATPCIPIELQSVDRELDQGLRSALVFQAYRCLDV